jgi:hypothetical protein
MFGSDHTASGRVPEEDGIATSEARLLDDLADEIAELSAHIDAATYRLLKAIAEFDRREGWEGGFLSCAQWLSLRIGMDLVTAREKVRVAHALEGLPLISEAFRQGRVSYSKVRAMVRVATEKNEELLLRIALDGTASHVEKLVRGYRRGSRAEEMEEACRQREDRYLEYYTDVDGMVVFRGRLPAEAGACVIKALEAAMDSLSERDASCAGTGGVADDSAESSGAWSAGADGESLEPSNLSHGGDGAQSWPEAGSRIEHDCSESQLEDACFSGDDSAESSEMRSTLGQLRADALGLIAEMAVSGGLGAAERGELYQVVVHVDVQALSDPCSEGLCELENGQHIPADTCRRLSCDASALTITHGADGDVLHVGRRSRKVTLPLWRALVSRDRMCQFPGCGRTGHLATHHIRHWAEGGETEPENLILLCRAHHWAVHEGGCLVEGHAPRGLVFRRPDGRILPMCPARASLPEDPVQALKAGNRALGLEIDAETGASGWCGETMDYELAVSGLLDADENGPACFPC